MAPYQRSFVIDDDDVDYTQNCQAPAQRVRSASAISVASSATLRGESPELIDLSRLSFEPRTSRLYPFVPNVDVGNSPTLDRERRPYSRSGSSHASGIGRVAGSALEPRHDGGQIFRQFGCPRSSPNFIVISDGDDESDLTSDLKDVQVQGKDKSEAISSRKPQPHQNIICASSINNTGRKRKVGRSVDLQDDRIKHQRRRIDKPVSIIIEEDEDEVDFAPGNAHVQPTESDAEDDQDVINVEDLEAELEQEMFPEDFCPPSEQRPNSRLPNNGRNTPIMPPLCELRDCQWKGYNLKARKTVELTDGSFLLIKHITQNSETDEVLLRGYKLLRSRELGGVLPKKLNELCFVFNVDKNDDRPFSIQGSIEEPVRNVKRIRRLICTNKAFPECRYNPTQVPCFQTTLERITHIEDHETLIVRWKYTLKFATARELLLFVNNPHDVATFPDGQLEFLTPDDSSKGFDMDAALKRYIWRGETVLGGSETDKTSGHQAYTSGDGYSGGGGSIRGALMSGLKVKFGFDFDANACATLRKNCRHVKVYENWVNDFVGLNDPPLNITVDVLHLSPPCQVFSPRHRPIVGKDDEMNFASLFGVGSVIGKARPRITTLEQTFGIMHRKFRDTFFRLLRMYTDHGYSVSWQLVKCAQFGLAQDRKRLIIVAAGPGEILPDFPEYTHSSKSYDHLRPLTTVKSILDSIPRNATQNSEADTSKGRTRIFRPWDASGLAPMTITTISEFGHPEGGRRLSIREAAALQTFPHDHFFCGGGTTKPYKQIGNAYPPIVAAAVFKHIVKHLKESDTAEKRRSSRL